MAQEKAAEAKEAFEAAQQAARLSILAAADAKLCWEMAEKLVQEVQENEKNKYPPGAKLEAEAAGVSAQEAKETALQEREAAVLAREQAAAKQEEELRQKEPGLRMKRPSADLGQLEGSSPTKKQRKDSPRDILPAAAAAPESLARAQKVCQLSS